MWLKKAPTKAHPVIWDPVVVIIRVAFITQAVFVVILLAGVGEVGAVILKGHNGTRGKEAALAMANVS